MKWPLVESYAGRVATGLSLTRILVMSDVLPLAEVKAKFSEMVDRVEQQHERITVTRNGRDMRYYDPFEIRILGRSDTQLTVLPGNVSWASARRW